MSQLALQLNDYRLTTAKIFYHLPDHPALLSFPEGKYLKFFVFRKE